MSGSLAVLNSLMLVLAGSSQNPDGWPKDHLYFPTKVGARWVYQSGKQEVIEVITAVEEKDGAMIASVAWERSGKVIPAYKLSVSEKGLFRLDGKSNDEPYCLLKLPHKPGEKWEKVLAAGRDTKVAVTVTAEEPEQIKVLAGTYKTVRFREEYTIRGKSYTTTFWYAPKVGLVKMEADNIDKVLKSFTPAP